MITGNYENLKINDKEVATKEYVDNLNTYSTTETVIGKWIDGRTLYRRVFTVTMPNSTSWSNIIALNYTNYYVVNIHGIMTSGSNTYIAPYSESEYTVALNHAAVGYIQVLQQSLAFSNHPFTVIVEYVKNV
jgi:GTP-dependent phosphoenolpyruvate carboxykinase